MKELIDEQIAYYRARAPEYEEWFVRAGRYDRGEAHRRVWLAEVAELERALEAAEPRGELLELACGTGLWTRRLAARAARVTALDASPEVIALNRERVGAENVEYVEADLFAWEPTRRWDFVFFGFWLTHVPPALFDAFWAKLRRALRPGGRVFFVDNTRAPEVLAKDHRWPEGGDVVMERRLNDGRRFRVIKVFYEPAELEARLAALGWRGFVRASRYFLYGAVA